MSEEKEKSQVDILQGEPIRVNIFGKETEIKRLSFTRQQDALRLISKVYSGDDAQKSHMEKISTLALEIVSLATDIPQEKFIQDGNLVEIMQAFKKIWRQNGFDFLSETVADLMTPKSTNN